MVHHKSFSLGVSKTYDSPYVNHTVLIKLSKAQTGLCIHTVVSGRAFAVHIQTKANWTECVVERSTSYIYTRNSAARNFVLFIAFKGQLFFIFFNPFTIDFMKLTLFFWISTCPLLQ